MNKEKWKPVPGHERYFISECGRVWDTWRKGLMKPTQDEKGYLRLQIRNWDGKREQWKVHRLVLFSFQGPSELTVDHLDTVKTNNHLTNLEYVTSLENTLRALKKVATPTQSDCHLCHGYTV